tara:strand:- start:7288 stop:8259 length:972 start_codon:yes stop_codon:yes gene_type:complete
MPSTYTTNGGIEKVATGEQSGTWGDTTNLNFDIIDRITNGVGTINLSSSGAAHTLTTTDGTLSDGMYRVLVLSSASQACTITIAPNDAQKLYFVKNSSGHNCVFSQGSGANVTINNGDTGVIFCDGAGSGAAVTAVAEDLSNLLTSTNNLSDLASAATALTNLGITSTAAELNILDGVTATTAELNILDGVTSTTAELNYNDITTLGTSQASKVVTADANGDVKFSNAIVETVYALTGTALDPNNGTTQTKTISSNTTFTDSLSSGESMSLHLTSASSYTITWPTIYWVSRTGNIAPTLTASDTVVLFKISSTLYGVWIGSSA